jgi:hypothetical protein
MPENSAPSVDIFADYPRVPRPVKRIVMYPKIQPDTATALYLLQSFGEQLFPGVRKAPIEFWLILPKETDSVTLEKEGTLLLDIGHGLFDHHAANAKLGKRIECLSTVVAKYLNIDQHVALKKILAWARRNDIEGIGVMSEDPLDKAFSLPNLLMLLNREYAGQSEKVLRIALELVAVHVRSEFHRLVGLPTEWDRLQKEGKIISFEVTQGPADLLGVALESDDIGFASFIRTVKKKDIVVQKRTTGHTNIITKQLRSIDMRPLIAALRIAEAQKKGTNLTMDIEVLQRPGRMSEVEEWYYDDAANTIQNGGAFPQGLPPTRLSEHEIIGIIKQSLPLGRIGWLKRSRARDLGPNGTAEVIEE